MIMWNELLIMKKSEYKSHFTGKLTGTFQYSNGGEYQLHVAIIFNVLHGMTLLVLKALFRTVWACADSAWLSFEFCCTCLSGITYTVMALNGTYTLVTSCNSQCNSTHLQPEQRCNYPKVLKAPVWVCRIFSHTLIGFLVEIKMRRYISLSCLSLWIYSQEVTSLVLSKGKKNILKNLPTSS